MIVVETKTINPLTKTLFKNKTSVIFPLTQEKKAQMKKINL